MGEKISKGINEAIIAIVKMVPDLVSKLIYQKMAY
jgi:hypothetical protein